MPDRETIKDARLVAVELHTRRTGELQWHDRGKAHVPETVTTGRSRALRYDAVVYAVEDVYDDGRTVTVWARAPESPGRRPLPPH